MHSWSTRTTPLRLSLSPPHSELLPTRQGNSRQASRTKTKSTVGSSHILPSRCLTRRPRFAVQLVCCTQSSISDFPSGIAPDVRGLACSWCSAAASVSQVLSPLTAAHTCLDSDSWPASCTIGGKLDPLHQALCNILRQSSEHQEYSLLCLRCSVPSATPGFPRVEGRPQAPIARLPLP